MTKDSHAHSKLVVGIKLTAQNTNNDADLGEAIDMAGFESCLFVMLTGVIADSAATFTVKLQHRDTTAASWVDCTAHETIGNADFTQAADDTTRKIGYIGAKRYSRMHIKPATNAGAWAVAVVAILGHPRYASV